jgi:hypothetical protein
MALVSPRAVEHRDIRHEEIAGHEFHIRKPPVEQAIEAGE